MNKLFSKGFTLIELMIVVVIIGILAAFAFSSYSRNIVESRRADAQIGLTQLAAQEEKFFSQCNRYVVEIDSGTIAACTGLGIPTSGNADEIFSPNQFYRITVAPGGSGIATSFTATAAPVAGTQANDGFFAISHTGLKQWDKNNSDAIDANEGSWKK